MKLKLGGPIRKTGLMTQGDDWSLRESPRGMPSSSQSALHVESFGSLSKITRGVTQANIFAGRIFVPNRRAGVLFYTRFGSLPLRTVLETDGLPSRLEPLSVVSCETCTSLFLRHHLCSSLTLTMLLS